MNQVVPTRSRSIAIMLAVLLGGLGIHKFYTNKPGWGILYIIFCWTFVPMILGLIEGIYWLTLSDAQFQAKIG